MKSRTCPTLLATLVVIFGISGATAAEPAPCSVAVGITTRTGTYRTWTNALETMKLADKGLTVCQDDAILNLSNDQLEDMDDAKAAALLKCESEFKLELLFRSDNMTRRLTISKGGKAFLVHDYLPNPSSIGSLKILKTIPTCAALQKIAAQVLGETAPATGN